MDRDLPAGLSDTQRNVLSEFFAGRIPAGQLTTRLEVAAPVVVHRHVDPDARRWLAVRILNLLRGGASRRAIAASAPSRPGTR